VIGGGYAAGDADDLYGIVAGFIYLSSRACMQARVEAQSAPVREIGEPRDSFRESAKHCIAMADGFVAGQAQASTNVFVRGRMSRSSLILCKGLRFS